MEARDKSVVSTRLKREDCRRTKHDSAFSEWKMLIGPSDWEDHLLKKEGAEKYRTQNLPNCSSCSGLYELGIAVLRPQSGREVGKLDKNCIVPVYLGQADNVRTRLQCYGREGAHLENGFSNGEPNDTKGRGLFTEIFSRGFAIVYRWSAMKNKRDAEETEARLLKKFDYAWNKGSNGARRPDDILQKLDLGNLCAARFPPFVRKLQNFHQRQVGLRIKSCKPLLLENGSSLYTNPERNDIFSRIFKFGRSRPILVSMGFGANDNRISICGVALGRGSVCVKPPVEGRKRCAEHKWMKVNGSTSKLITEDDASIGSSILSDPGYNGHHQGQKVSFGTPKLQPAAVKCPVNEELSPTCGVALVDGSPCTKVPVQGRKRCKEHKGWKIHEYVSQSVTEEKKKNVTGPVLESRTPCNDYGRISSESHKPGRQQSQVYSERCRVNKDYDTICGVDLEDGTFCTRQPVVGRKRCEEHKGRRVNEPVSKLLEAGVPSVFAASGFSFNNDQAYKNTSAPPVSYRSDFSSTCGATTRDGSFCSRKPATGRKRCWQHEGMRVNASSRTSACNESMYNGNSSRSVSYSSFVNEGFSSTCGATTGKGSFCRRKPATGRNRCWQHS